MPPEIRTLPDLRLACLRHTGPLGGESVGRLWRRFEIHAGNAGLLGPDRIVLGIARDDPATTPASALHYDACVQVVPEYDPAGNGFFLDTLPGATYTCVRHDGDAGRIVAAWRGAIAGAARLDDWRIDDRLPVEWYDRGLELDVKGRFSCLLCVPVKRR